MRRKIRMTFAVAMMLKGLCSGSISKYRNSKKNSWKIKKIVDNIFFVIFWLYFGRFPYLEVYPGP